MNSADSAFFEILFSFVFPFPTHKGNILDIIITDVSDLVTNIAILTPVQAGLSTDHDLFEFNFVAFPRWVRKPVCYVYNFKLNELTLRISNCRLRRA